MRFSRLSAKITAFLMLLIISSVFIYSFVFITSERRRLKNEIRENGQTFGEFLSSTIYQNYIQYYRHNTEEDFLQFKSIVENELKKNVDIIHVSLLGVNGRILFDSDEFTNGQYNKDDVRFIEDEEVLSMLKEDGVQAKEGLYNGDSVVETIVPISESGIGHIASVKYTVSYKELNQRLTEVYKEALVSIIPVLLVCTFLNILFSYRIAAPIVRLKDFTTEVGTGNLEVKTNIRTKDEIGDLAASFDKMTQELLKSRKKEEHYTHDLESQVKERTKELAAKVEELEKFNRMIVDREIKMIELKAKLKACEQRNEKLIAEK